MSLKRSAILILAWVLVLFYHSTLLGLTEAESPKNLSDKVDEYIKPYVETGNFSGAVLIAKKGTVLLNKGYGKANDAFDVPNNSQTKFHLASVSKSFTAAAILMLEERNLLKLTDPLTKYIPDYPNGNKITIHHLLSHTSGIPDVNSLPEYINTSHLPQTPETLIKMFKDKPLKFNPGERYSYSNSNYNLLAYIIEKVSGKSYGEFLKENIFEPLDMKNTGHHGDAGLLLKNSAVGYSPRGSFGLEVAPYLDWSSKTGNGSLYSTVEDLYKWDRALYTEKILKKSSLNKLFTDHINGAGYGWFVTKRLNRHAIYINGRSPGFGSYLGRFVDDDVCIIVLGNNYISVATQIGTDLAALVLGESYEILKIHRATLHPKTAKALIGQYQFGERFYVPNFTMTVSEKDGYLFTDWGPLIPSTEKEYIQRSYWSKVKFEQDENGSTTAMSFDDYKGRKIK